MYYRDNSGIEHESYDEACNYYGADTPASLKAEDEWMAESYREEIMDRMMAGEVQPAAIFDSGDLYWDMDPDASLDRDGIPF